MKRTALMVMGLVLSLAAVSGVASAASKASEIVNESRQVVEEMMAAHDKGVPQELLRKCAGVAIIPSVVKGGFFVGGSYGRGVLMARRGGKWVGPAFLEVGSGSLGLQFGLEAVDLILVIMNERGMKSLSASKVKLGADMGLAAGPVGARAEAASDVQFKAEIYSYSRAKGLFAGIALEGAVVSPMEERNQLYYGKELSNDDILFRGKTSPPASGQKLIRALEKITR